MCVPRVSNVGVLCRIVGECSIMMFPCINFEDSNFIVCVTEELSCRWSNHKMCGAISEWMRGEDLLEQE